MSFTGKSLLDRKRNKVKALLTKENILDRVSETQIMEYYTREPVSMGKVFCSPFRNDSNPGCKYGVKNGRLYFFDHSKDLMLDCFNVVQHSQNLSFRQALERINQDLGLGLGTNQAIPVVNQIERVEYQKTPIKYHIEAKPWDESSLSYWKSFGITEKTLKEHDVYNTKNVYKDGKFTSRSTEKNPIFTYILPSGNCKHYRPLSRDKSRKWWGNTNKLDLFGRVEGMQPGELLIITSSLKDVMVCHEAGYTAVAPQNEHSSFDQSFLDEVNSKFDKIIVIYDNDETGLTQMKQCKEKYGWDYAVPPMKDIADYSAATNIKSVKKFLDDAVQQQNHTIDWEAMDIPF